MPSSNYAYVNGKFVLESEATVSIFDRGFLYGDGCFETMRVYGGCVFRVLEHFHRLFDGLAALEIDSPFSPQELVAVCRALISRNAVDDGVARVYITRDSMVATAMAREFNHRELRAMVSSVRVDSQISRFKTANRLPYILAQHEARHAGKDDAVLLNLAGNVVELTTSNLFAVKAGVMYTPPLSDGALPGVTREAIMSLLPVREESFAPSFLDNADEVFAANSVMEIAPVLTWSRAQTMTNRVAAAYRKLVARELSTLVP
jgi:branched-chain amino acid aminotransferase